MSLTLAAKSLQLTSTGHVTLQKYVRGSETEKEKRSNTVTPLDLRKPGYQASGVLTGSHVSLPVVCHWVHTYTGAVVSTNNVGVRVHVPVRPRREGRNRTLARTCTYTYVCMLIIVAGRWGTLYYRCSGGDDR